LGDEHRYFPRSVLLGKSYQSVYRSDVATPAAVSVFPGENYDAPQSWTERAYHNLIYFNRVGTGGHYAAWERPQVFCEEVRAGLRPLRTLQECDTMDARLVQPREDH
jgi:hypothetical protein